MKILIVAATAGEIVYKPMSKKHEVDLLITGVGMVATAYALTRALQLQRYDLALQVGVAGSFDQDIATGEVVLVTNEQYADLGAEDHDAYLDVFEMGLLQKDVHPFSGTKLEMPLLPIHKAIHLRNVSGLTVNTVSGSERTINMRGKKYNCQVESMEGVAFHYVCLQEQVPFAQVRAISNYVEPRNKANWKMKDAIIALNKWLIDFLETI